MYTATCNCTIYIYCWVSNIPQSVATLRSLTLSTWHYVKFYSVPVTEYQHVWPILIMLLYVHAHDWTSGEKENGIEQLYLCACLEGLMQVSMHLYRLNNWVRVWYSKPPSYPFQVIILCMYPVRSHLVLPLPRWDHQSSVSVCSINCTILLWCVLAPTIIQTISLPSHRMYIPILLVHTFCRPFEFQEVFY